MWVKSSFTTRRFPWGLTVAAKEAQRVMWFVRKFLWGNICVRLVLKVWSFLLDDCSTRKVWSFPKWNLLQFPGDTGPQKPFLILCLPDQYLCKIERHKLNASGRTSDSGAIDDCRNNRIRNKTRRQLFSIGHLLFPIRAQRGPRVGFTPLK